MNIIIYQIKDEITTVFPAQGVAIEQLTKFIPEGIKYSIISSNDLPKDLYFQNAWELIDGKVKINIEKAKEIQRNVWRKIRESKLKELDLLYMKALEEGDKPTQKNIITQKKALRDVTTIELPDDVDIIRDTIPDILI